MIYIVICIIICLIFFTSVFHKVILYFNCTESWSFHGKGRYILISAFRLNELGVSDKPSNKIPCSRFIYLLIYFSMMTEVGTCSHTLRAGQDTEACMLGTSRRLEAAADLALPKIEPAPDGLIYRGFPDSHLTPTTFRENQH